MAAIMLVDHHNAFQLSSTHVSPTCLNVTPCRPASLRESPPCGLLLTLMLARSTVLGNFSATWGMISVNVVEGSTVSLNWPSRLTNLSIIALIGLVGFVASTSDWGCEKLMWE